MNTQPIHRSDYFEPGDSTALVCVDEPDLQRLVFEQLDQLQFKIHSGLFVDDITLKLRSQAYNLVLVHEHFGGTDYETNPVVQEIGQLPQNIRRQSVVVLIGANMATSNALQAFCLNADHVVNLHDVNSLALLVRRALLRHREVYQKFDETLKSTV